MPQGGTYATGHVPTAQELGMAPQSAVNDGLWELLKRISGAEAMGTFAAHPGVGTGLEAAAALPLPYAKALRGAELFARLSELTPKALRVLAAGAGRGFAATGNVAAAENAVQHPNQSTLLTALGLALPTPEAGALRTSVQTAKTAALMNAAANRPTAGGASNVVGAFPFRNEEDIRGVESLLSMLDRTEALHNAATEHQQPRVVHPLLQLLMHQHGTVVAPGHKKGA